MRKPRNPAMSNSNGVDSAESGIIQPTWDLETIIATVSTNPEPGMAISALHAIRETLANGSDEQLDFFPVLPVAQFLVKSLSRNGTFEENLLAARGIAYLCESLPSSINTVVSCGTIPAICEQLQGMEYLDIAEECVKVLEKIADEDPLSCLRGGAVTLVVNLIVFFSCNIQARFFLFSWFLCFVVLIRTAMSMVDLSIGSCTEEDASLVVDAVPTLCSMAKHEDLQIADCATFSLLNLVRSFSGSSVLLDELCKRGVISTSIEILSDLFGAGVDERCINSFDLLTTAAAHSLLVTRTLLELNVGSIIRKYLLLIPDHSDIGYVKILVSGAKMEIRYGCVGIMYNITYFTTSDMLPDLMKNANISRCLANLLTVKNCHILVPSLKIVDTLMTKLPGYCLNSFVEDGVVNAVDELVLLHSAFAGRSEARLEETLAGHAHDCFCDVLNSHLISSSSISGSCRVENSGFVELAKAIKATYFAEEVISNVGYSKTIKKIKDSCMELKNAVDLFTSGVFSSSNEANLSSILGRVMRELTKQDSMSPNVFVKKWNIENSEALSKVFAWFNKKISKVLNTYQKIDDCMPNYIFFMDGKQLDRSLTLYQNILQQKVTAKTGYVIGPEFWENVHKVTYTRVEELSSADCSELCLRTDMSHYSDGVALLNWPKFLQSTRSLLNEFSVEPEEADFLRDVFFIMKIFESIDRYSFQILFSESKKDFAVGKVKNTEELVKVIASSDVQKEFVNAKLSDKLEQQMKDALVMKTGRMPSWCTKLMTSFPFLISFESKIKYLFLTTFKSSVNGNGRPEIPLHEIFVVNRTNILVSAEKMMAKYLGSGYLIELEYAGEAGIGVGPTVEFYTLVSHEFRKHGLGIWRGDFTSFDCPAISESSRKSLDSGLIATCAGLFPRPFSLKAKSKSKRKKTSKKFSDVINKKFVLLGQIVARAIMDKRILDIPFSRAFYKLILGQELDMYDILSFDPDLGRTLLEFQALVDRKRFVDANAELSRDASIFSFRNSRIEDLCIEFALPGYPDYTLPSKRNKEMVNIDNLEEYVSLVVDATVKSGIANQIEAFKFGFNKAFPLEALQIFNEAELERLICGEATHWNSSDLQRHVQFDHGYTSESPQAIFLLDIMLELEHDQRKAFIQFLTGSPRLPIGGLGGFSPPFTVAKRFCLNVVDEELPSVMTCVNYLKLPAYSSKEIMRQKILYAITEGRGTFPFS
ncbi:hypothetical protein HPP92_002855 [Vanilla planifolia]|uniref:HECT-type E3 ubiquitin transferase n=1 Tax=Vanilla planifolia TaxID=51239 RepID=A0A835S549_VANPL|nr:hypothetical protein HPP92_002855 [Vanilla planifolia]